ncbi:hypothetical protein C9417_06300 [Rhizobium sp. SEMIA 4088]|nr:hypothetical protein C9417_06300 [Rhizobium sp. SEMIA 4088]
MTKPPVFPLVMKIVLGSAEFNPILAGNENYHRFDNGLKGLQGFANMDINIRHRWEERSASCRHQNCDLPRWSKKQYQSR